MIFFKKKLADSKKGCIFAHVINNEITRLINRKAGAVVQFG